MIMSKNINIEFLFMRVYARQHGGGDELSNLALCCVHCNIIRRLELRAEVHRLQAGNHRIPPAGRVLEESPSR